MMLLQVHDHAQEVGDLLTQADPSLVPVIVSALVIALMGGALSVFVVLKRLAFIGQGISHSAFGGIGIAMILGIHGVTTAGAIGQLAVVVAFSVLAALWIAAITRSHGGRADTAIGVVLSASMALGFVLFSVVEAGHEHTSDGMAVAGHEDQHHLIEEILFGNILDTNWTKAAIALGVGLAMILLTWLMRRRLIFWAFDEPVVDAFGMNSKRTTNLFMVMLALAVVLAMQIAGVVLAAAILVLPGASALNLSAKLRTVFTLSLVISLVGAVVGLAVGIEGGYPIGPMVVLVQSVIYLLALGTKSVMPKLRS